MTQSLTRRGFVFLDELIASGEMPEEDLSMFPGYGAREIHVPKECKLGSGSGAMPRSSSRRMLTVRLCLGAVIKAFHIFARPLAEGAALTTSSQGSSSGAKRVRQRVRKRAL